MDNLLEGLVKAGLNAIRLGRPESTKPELAAHSLEEMVPKEADPPSKAAARARLIAAADVVCCTCIGAGSAVLAERKSKKKGKGGGGAAAASSSTAFPGVLIDEAAQATELAAIVPLGLGCQQLVLVGDHHQVMAYSCNPRGQSLLQL